MWMKQAPVLEGCHLEKSCINGQYTKTWSRELKTSFPTYGWVSIWKKPRTIFNIEPLMLPVIQYSFQNHVVGLLRCDHGSTQPYYDQSMRCHFKNIMQFCRKRCNPMLQLLLPSDVPVFLYIIMHPIRTTHQIYEWFYEQIKYSICAECNFHTIKPRHASW